MSLPQKIEAYFVSHESESSTQLAVNSLKQSSDKFLKRVTVLNHSVKDYPIQGARTIHFPHNPSLTRAWNTAIGMSETDWTLLSNDDVFFDYGWFEEFLNHHESGTLWHGASNCFLIHRDCIRRVGWFDENFLGMYYEDLDYLRRMNEAGIKKCYWQECPMHEKIFHHRLRQGGALHSENKINHDYMKTKYENADPNDFFLKPKFKTPNFHWRTPWLLDYQS